MRIKITKYQRDYFERIHYDAVRYRDLLLCARREDCNATEEEWNESFLYYQKKCEEAQQTERAMLETISELYPDLNGTEWRIDFADSSLTDEPLDSSVTKNRTEGYSDELIRLFPELCVNEPIRRNCRHCKDITFQVTEDCNLQCTYCYQHNKTKNRMSFDTAKDFVDLLLDSDERTNTYITSETSIGAVFNFIGGEPWLEIDLIDRISRYIVAELFRRRHPWATRYMFCVCTNGVLHFDSRVQDYIRRNANHFSYSVTVDGDKTLHDSCRVDAAGNGSYDNAMAAVKDYCKNGGRVGSKMTISPDNVHLVKDAVKNLVTEGYRSIHLNCVYEEGWTNDYAHTLYHQLHDLADWLNESGHLDDVFLSIFNEYHCVPRVNSYDNNWCGGNGMMVAVNHSGNIYPCLRYMESSVGETVEPFIIGDVVNGINVLPEHKSRVSCLDDVTYSSQSTQECMSCPIATGCGWCSAYNYEKFGTVNHRATFICCMHKARALATYYYLAIKGRYPKMYCPREWAVPIIGEAEFDRLEAMHHGG